MSSRRTVYLIVAFAFSQLPGAVVHGQTAYDWISNQNGLWSTFGNWSDPSNNPSISSPGALDSALFDSVLVGPGNPAAASITVTTAGQQVNSIVFDSNATDYIIAGSGLSLSGNAFSGISKTGDEDATFSATLTLLGNVAIANNNSSGLLSFSNVNGNLAGRQFNVGTGTGAIAVNGGGSNVIFNLSAGNNTLSGISSSTINLSGGTNTIASASNTTININTLSGTNTITNVTGGSVNNTVSGATITGATNIGDGSSHSVAGTGVGTLNVNGNLSYTNSTFLWNLNQDSTIPADFDRVIGNGSSFSGSGSTLSLNLGPMVSFADSFWTMNQNWSIFSGFTFNSNPFSSITVTGGGGPAPGTFSFNNGTLSFITAVPEPSSICLLGLALIGGCVARRRKLGV